MLVAAIHRIATSFVAAGVSPAILTLHFPGEITSHAHPARKQSPPIGVIGPNQRAFVSAITYKLPLKIRIPVKSNHHAPRFAVPKSASTNSAIA